jgi:Zn-dependent metalloprotease
VTAVANVERVETFFESHFKYTMSRPIDVVVHVGGGLNAFAGPNPDETRTIVMFTDGAAGQTPLMGALAVVGHEMTHVVNSLSNGLGQQGEAASIAEGVADVFGISIRNEAGKGSSYAIEEAHRDAQHPNRFAGQRDNYKARDQSGGPVAEYANATIVSNAWVLMTDGGKNDTSQRVVATPGLGSTSQRVWWSSLRKVVGPKTQISDLARAQVAYATKQNIRVEPVACAWLAVDALDEAWVKQQNIKCPELAGCGHDVCTFGEALGPQCNSCTKKVCDVDPYCCTEHWGPSCWPAVEAQCGVTCSGAR